MTELQRQVRESRPPGRGATLPPRRQPPPCKHCAASAQKRRKVSRSFRHLLAKLLEPRIFAERIPHRIEAEIGPVKSGWHLEQTGQGGDGRIQVAKTRLDLGKQSFSLRLEDGVV